MNWERNLCLALAAFCIMCLALTALGGAWVYAGAFGAFAAWWVCAAKIMSR